MDQHFARPASEREAFAHAYADRIAESLRNEAVIPFPPLEKADPEIKSKGTD